MLISELSARQIVGLANEGSSVEQIAAALDVEPAMVKLVLSRNSAGEGSNDRDITDEDLVLLRRRALDLALGAQDEGIQARLTMFLIERDKPREHRETSNLVTINQAIVNARIGFDKLLNEYAPAERSETLAENENENEKQINLDL